MGMAQQIAAEVEALRVETKEQKTKLTELEESYKVTLATSLVSSDKRTGNAAYWLHVMPLSSFQLSLFFTLCWRGLHCVVWAPRTRMLCSSFE